MKQHPKHKGVPQHYGRGKPSNRGKVVRSTVTPGIKKAAVVSSGPCLVLALEMIAVLHLAAVIVLRVARR
jgi:hypothetical protein